MFRMISTTAAASFMACFCTIVLGTDDIVGPSVPGVPAPGIEFYLSGSVSHVAEKIQRYVSVYQGSYVFSPYGLSSAMIVLFMGAVGETKSEIMEAVFPNNNPDDMYSRNYVGNVVGAHEGLASFNSRRKPSLQVQMATLIAIHSTVNVLPLYQQDVAYFKANFDKLDLTATSTRNAINRHVEAGTNGSIPMFLNSRDTLKPPSVLANAIAFKIHWDLFENAFQQTLPFRNIEGHVRNVTMITFAGTFRFKSFGFASMLELPYAGQYTIFIVLPETLEVLRKVDKGIFVDFGGDIYSLREKYLQVTIPMFKLDSFFNLNEAVKDLGVRRPFKKEGSGLSKITNDDGFFLGDVLQRAVVEFGDRNSLPCGKPNSVEKGHEFLIDRPFFFDIRTESHGLKLFRGRVENID